MVAKDDKIPINRQDALPTYSASVAQSSSSVPGASAQSYQAGGPYYAVSPPPPPPPPSGNIIYIPVPAPLAPYLLPPPQAFRRRPSNACSRFCKALIVGIFVWIVITTLLSRIADIAWRGVQHLAPSESDGQVVRCYPHVGFESNVNTSSVPLTRWHDSPLSEDGSSSRRRATLELDLNGDAEALYAIARGGPSIGLVTLAESSTDRATARVEVEYTLPEWHSYSNVWWQVCELRDRKYGRGSGLGVYMPYGWSWWWRRTVDLGRMKVNVTLHVPPSIRKVSTDASNYAHDLRIGERVGLEKIIVRGSNAKVTSEATVANQIEVRTSNARIEGSYTATEALALVTSNGAILTNVTLGTLTSPSRKPMLSMTTSNAAIRGTARLVGASRFDTRLHTSNDALDVAILTLPPDAVLSLSAHTSNARAHITLPSTFEGSIDQSTSNAGTPDLVVLDPDMKDPKGQGRKYNVETRRISRGSRDDRVMWGRISGSGSVQLRTSNAHSGVEISPEWK